MWDKFGEFESAEELNKAAEGLKAEGDTECLKDLAKENGIDIEDAVDYINGLINELATVQTAALGKLDIECADLGLPGNILMYDWVDQIKTYAMENEAIAVAIKRKDRTLAGCMAMIMLKAFSNQWKVPDKIMKEAKIRANEVTFGIPSAASVNKIIKDYYRAPIEINEEAAGEEK